MKGEVFWHVVLCIAVETSVNAPRFTAPYLSEDLNFHIVFSCDIPVVFNIQRDKRYGKSKQNCNVWRSLFI
jgi:hypothetical protein